MIMQSALHAQSLIESTKVNPDPWYYSINMGYQGVHQSGPYVHLKAVRNERWAFEIGGGYDFLYSATATGTYFINQGANQFYTGLGYGYYTLRQRKSYLFEIQTAHSTFGYQSRFGKRLVVNTEIAFVKYIEQFFKLPRVNYTESFSITDGIYFEIGVSLGYRLGIAK